MPGHVKLGKAGEPDPDQVLEHAEAQLAAMRAEKTERRAGKKEKSSRRCVHSDQ